MLKSGPSQNNLNGEDSSASDAGSEVSFGPTAAETDRFGFILTNGSTAGSEGPPPELVRQREAKWINIITQWDRVVQKKTSKVKEQCQKGIPASLRARCWPLLCGATNKMKHNNLYKSLDSQPALQSWVDVIERDLDRQFPFHEMFLSKEGHGQRGLFRVLKAYTQFQPDDGYCQAQGPVAAVLLMNMPTEEAFWCLVQISQEYLPGYYSPLLEGVLFDAAMLPWILKRTCPAAHKHLQQHGVEPLMFATDWLMCLFTRHLPFNTLLRVWDLFFCHGVRVLFQVVVVLVRRVLGRAEQRQECQGQMETLERLRGVKEQVQQEDDTFIAEMCSVPLSGKELEKQTEKELVKWRKARPLSTFDPRGRCHGYRVAWKRVREMEAERDRREREQGNLSFPLIRSASTLSLSPSLMRKKLRKSAKTNVGGEWEGGGRVGRQLSLGPWEAGGRDRWMERSPKKAQCLEEEEDKVLEKHKEQPFEGPRERTESQGAKHVGEREILQEPRGQEEETQDPPTVLPQQTKHCEEEDNQPIEEEETQDPPTVLPQQTKHCEEEDNQPIEEEETQDPPTVLPQQTKHCEEEDNQPIEEEETQDPPTVLPQQTKHCEEEDNQPIEEEETQDPPTVLPQQTKHCEEEDNQPIEEEETQDPPTVLPQQTKHCEEEEGTGEEEGRMGETDQTRDPTKMQSIENVVQHIAHRTPRQELATQDQWEEQDNKPNSQSQTLDGQSHNRLQQEQEKENKDRVETQQGEKKQVTESENVSVKEEDQTEIERNAHTNTVEDIQAVTDTSKEPVIQMGIKAVEKREAEYPRLKNKVNTDIKVESENCKQSDTDVEVETTKDSDPEKETKSQREPDATTDTVQEAQVETVEIRGTDDKGRTESHTETDENKNLRENSSGTQEELETQATTEANIDELQRKISSLKETRGEAEKEVSAERTEEETDLTVDTATCTETERRPVDSKTESDEALPEYSESLSEIELSKPTEAREETVIHTKNKVDEDTNAGHQTQTEMYQETTDSITPQENSQTSMEPATSASEPDEKTSSLPTASEQPRGLVTISPVEDQYMMEKIIETVAGAEGVLISSPKPTVLSNVPQPTHKNESCTIEKHNATDPHHQNKEDSHLPADQAELEACGHMHSAGRRVSTTSADFRIRKSSSSRGLARRLSEDLFTAPQQTTQSQSIPSQPDQSKHTLLQSDPATTHSLDQTHLDSAHSGGTIHQPIQEGIESELCKQETSGTEEGTAAQREQRPPDTPKRFGLFRRLRGEQPKKTQEKGEPKKTKIPKILIQDFSDGVGRGCTLEEMEEEKLSSRERRKRRRERERREKEEEKLRKKREKELEKERDRERRKPKSRGASFQVQRDSGSNNAAPPGNIGSQKLSSRRNSVPYAESYF